MELTFVVAVKTIWQIQPSWLHPCKVCDKGRSVGKIYREYLFQKNAIKDAKRRILTLFEAMFGKLVLQRKF